MDDLHRLRQRASELRQRIQEFVEDFGREIVPHLGKLHDELAQIEDNLRALGEHVPDEET